MTRTKRSILVFIFVLAAALLPQALFAATRYGICADEADPGTCENRQPASHTLTLAAKIEALSATYPSVAHTPERSLAAKIEALSATYPSAGSPPAPSARTGGESLGVADADQSITAGMVGIGQPQSVPARLTPSAGDGLHCAEQ